MAPPLRFAPGWHLFTGPDGAWRLADPDGSFLRVSGEDHVLAAYAQGIQAPGDAGLRDGLLARGALAVSAPGSPGPGLRVHVAGGDPIALAAATLLAGRAEVATGTVDEDAVASCDALLVSTPQLCDALFQQVDGWCREYGATWTMCFGEGTSFVLGPAGRPGTSASYVDTRGRRLAAAPLPDELAALWAHLDTGAPATDVLVPTPEVAAVLAGLLVHDLLGAATGMASGRQLVVDPITLTYTSHPVLALPRGIQAATLPS